MNDKMIQWPRAAYWDKAWNPIVGCKPASPACENCYARAMARRFKMRGCDDFEPISTTRERPPRRGVVFCGNMTDLFGEWLDRYTARDFVEQTIDVSSEENVYLYLTKRVERMCDALVPSDANEPLLRNHYFGFTAENQKWYDRRVIKWRDKFPLGVNGWLSAEPLLGPIDLWLDDKEIRERVKWIVVGCESGPNRRPCSLSWIESIVEQSVAHGILVFVKQIEIDGKCVRDIEKFPEHLRIRQVPWKTAAEEEARRQRQQGGGCEMSKNIENAESVKLNTCPRCGSAPQLLFCEWDYQHDAPGGYYVMCMECLTICRTLFATAKEAADNWNTYIATNAVRKMTAKGEEK